VAGSKMNSLKKQLLVIDINDIKARIIKLISLKEKTERTIEMYKIRLKNKEKELE